MAEHNTAAKAPSDSLEPLFSDVEKRTSVVQWERRFKLLALPMVLWQIIFFLVRNA